MVVTKKMVPIWYLRLETQNTHLVEHILIFFFQQSNHESNHFIVEINSV